MGRVRKAAALGLMVVCGWCASAADAFVGTAILGRVAWSPLARRLSGGAQSSVTHRRLGKNGEVYELKMGFLGWDIGADLGGGKGIRDMLGIIRSGAGARVRHARVASPFDARHPYFCSVTMRFLTARRAIQLRGLAHFGQG